ncbi:very short patch repair endonuclease [Camelimonas fluminis]|uniref:Very short patch repair endonuclease n=1 Tax=Camelimonas fluminis TaxID=1576911 RepID=A0ABV7UF02_9HYPH|nr:very short patch repair endonuclease [Camelimonas fluminis]GHE74225.1 very short patch repair endonuclease [Camelimonas fluminis]
MADIVDAPTRSRMMRGIRGKNTRPEMAIRRALHARGLRFRLHDRKLPGAPDLVFPKFRAVIFVHGCFWHGHGCHMFRWPATRAAFWRAKISHNQEVDARAASALLGDGWRVAEVWECALRGRRRQSINDIAATLAAWLASDAPRLEIPDASDIGLDDEAAFDDDLS